MASNSEISRRRLLLGGAGFAGALAVGACSSASGAGSSAGSTSSGSAASTSSLPVTPTAELEALSKKEDGKLLWYGGGAPEAEPALKAAFQKLYPWITLTIADLTQDARPQKLLLEHATHAPTADVTTGDPGFFQTLVPQGVVKAVALESDAALPSTLVDPAHYFHAMYQLLVSPMYNTRLISTLPNDPYDFADPSWKGKLAFDDVQSRGQAYTWLLSWQTKWGTAKWTTWLDGLQANGIFLTGDSAGNTYDDVLRGERPVGIGGSNSIGTQAAGTPMKASYLYPPVPLAVSLWMVSDSVRPASAQLFLNFMVSNTAQLILAQGWRSPVLPGVNTPAAVEKILAGTGQSPVPFTQILPLLKNPNGLDKTIDNHFPQ